MLRSTVTRKMSADRDSRRRIEVANLVSGGGCAEDESLWEAPPREPSSVPALRNASLQRHAEDEEKQQQPRQFHGVYLAYFSLPLSLLPLNKRRRETENWYKERIAQWREVCIVSCAKLQAIVFIV